MESLWETSKYYIKSDWDRIGPYCWNLIPRSWKKVTLFYTHITGLWGERLCWMAGKLIWPSDIKNCVNPVLIHFCLLPRSSILTRCSAWEYWACSNSIAWLSCCCCFSPTPAFSWDTLIWMQGLLESLEFVCLDSEDLSSAQERELLFIYVPRYPSWNHPHFCAEYWRHNADSCALRKKEGGKQMVEGEIGNYGVSFRNL